MAKALKRPSQISGEWIARDLNSWRVRVPCQGGSGRFYFRDYGGVQKSLDAAIAFQERAIKQLEDDRKYREKHGELPKREVLRITNTTGYQHISRAIYPNFESRPNIVFRVQIGGKGAGYNAKHFTSAHYGDEHKALKEALKYRAELYKKLGKA